MARKLYTQEERRKQFLAAGDGIVRKNGIKALTMQAVANECGVSAPMVFHIFGSRDQMREDVIAKLPKTFAAKARAELDARPVRKSRKATPVVAKKSARSGAAAKKPSASAAPTRKRATKKFPTIAAPATATE